MRYAFLLLLLLPAQVYGQSHRRTLQEIERRTAEIEANCRRLEAENRRLDQQIKDIQSIRARNKAILNPRGKEAYSPEEWQAMIEAGEANVRDERARFESPLGREGDVQRRLTENYFAKKAAQDAADAEYLAKTGWGSKTRFRDDPVVGYGDSISNFDVQQVHPNGRAEQMTMRQYAEIVKSTGASPGPWFGQGKALAESQGRKPGVSATTLHGMTGEQRLEAAYQRDKAQKQYAQNILHQQAYNEMLNRKQRIEDHRNNPGYSYWYWYYRSPGFYGGWNPYYYRPYHFHPYRWYW